MAVLRLVDLVGEVNKELRVSLHGEALDAESYCSPETGE
jgi:hypothetical protein